MTMIKRIAIFITSLALFIETIDTTILNLAVPAMAQSFNTEPLNLKMALISYCLSISIFVPISGWIADKYGAKRIFIYSLCMFTLSSVFCGYATNLFELTIFRALQGVGGAMMLPVGRLIISRVFDKHEIIGAFSHLAIFAALGTLLGPLLGGLITQYFSWPWIFWINIPVAILLIILACRFPAFFPEQEVSPLDKLGFLLFGGSLACLTLGLSALSEDTLSVIQALLIIIMAFGLMALYRVHSANIQYPIVNTKLFQIRSFRVSMIGSLAGRLAFGSIPFLLPIILQVGLHLSPKTSGLLLAPWAIGIMLAKPLVFNLVQLLGYRRLLIFNTIAVAFSTGGFITISAHTPFVLIGLLTFIYGFLISIQYGGMNSLTYADISNEDLGHATSMLGTMQQLTLSISVAFCSVVIKIFSSIAPTTLEINMVAFHACFLIMGLMILCSTLIFMELNSEDGRQLYRTTTQS